jgi:hypothetical protein
MRPRSRHVLITLAVLVVGLAMLRTAVELWPKPLEPGPILDFEPLSEDRVLVARMYRKDQARVFFLELVERRAGRRWQVSVPHMDEAACTRFPRCAPMTVAEGAGVLFFESTVKPLPDGAGRPQLSGFRLQDGRPLWEVAAAREAFVVAGGILLDITVDPTVALVAIDPPSGAERWRASLDASKVEDFGTVWARGTRLLALVRRGYSDDFDLHVLDAATGHEAARLRGRGTPCVAPDAVWLEDSGQHLLQRVSLDDLSTRAVPLPRGFSSVTPQGPCARRRHTVWIQAHPTPVEPRNPLGDTDYLFGFDADTLAPGHAVELGLPDVLPPRRVWGLAPDEEPLSGDAPRFVSVVVRELPQLSAQLQVVDLDEARIARSEPIGDAGYSLLRFDAQNYVLHGSGKRITAFDGESGQVTGELHRAVVEMKFGGGKLWIWTASGEVSALDARTLQPLWTVKPGGAVVEEASEPAGGHDAGDLKK